jgi:hypothetical protein
MGDRIVILWLGSHTYYGLGKGSFTNSMRFCSVKFSTAVCSPSFHRGVQVKNLLRLWGPLRQAGTESMTRMREIGPGCSLPCSGVSRTRAVYGQRATKGKLHYGLVLISGRRAACDQPARKSKILSQIGTTTFANLYDQMLMNFMCLKLGVGKYGLSV